MWNEVLSHMFSSRRKDGSLNIIVDSSLAGVVILTEYFQLSITLVFTEGLEVQLLQETGGASLPVRSSDATNEPSCLSLDGSQPTVLDAKPQAAEAYSKTGRTSCLQAKFLTTSELVRMFLQIKPRVEFPSAVTLSSCLFQFNFGSRVIPRYLMQLVYGTMVPCRQRFLPIDCVLCEKIMCSHLER